MQVYYPLLALVTFLPNCELFPMVGLYMYMNTLFFLFAMLVSHGDAFLKPNAYVISLCFLMPNKNNKDSIYHGLYNYLNNQ